MAQILIAEDDVAISDLICIHMKLAGHSTCVIPDGADVINAVHTFAPDLVLLDVMLPHFDGFFLMEQLAALPTAVIFLTAKDRMEDKIKGLTLGADDYIVKPFAAIELITRIEAVLRRYRKNESVFRMGALTVSLDARTVMLHGAPVDLTIKEFELLRILIKNKNLALSRDQLLDKVWGYDYYGGTRTVDVHIQRLRKKLRLEDAIHTVYKLGYRLEVPT